MDKIRPDYYKAGDIQLIEYLRAKLSKEEFIGAMKANVFKYLTRAGQKEETTALEDFEKAQWYLDELVIYMNIMRPINLDECVDYVNLFKLDEILKNPHVKDEIVVEEAGFEPA